jgi:glycosyltransferase involved in cell wall biosynthesis
MPIETTRIVYLTAGAGGMYCGSCLHDNTLARSLNELGFDVQLVPTYTPIRTDELDVSVDRIFFGGINVYLQQKLPPLRWLPRFLDRYLDSPVLINRLASKAVDLPAHELGQLALSMLRGTEGNQRKEVRRLTDWLVKRARPQLIIFTNALIGGCITEIKRRLDVPVLVTLQGDDVFLDSLPDTYRRACIEQIRRLVPLIDGFIVNTIFFRDYMSDYFRIPQSKFHIVPLGIDARQFEQRSTEGIRRRPTIGYLARLSPEKGLRRLVQAFIRLKTETKMDGLQLRIAGWLNKSDSAYAKQCFDELSAADLGDDFKYLGVLERRAKLEFLSSLDLLSVPTTYREPKGLYVLEAMASGVPVVQPAHGSFPEMITSSQGGLLFDADDPDDYFEKLTQLLTDDTLRARLGEQGRQFVFEHRNARRMSEAMADVIGKYLPQL